MENPLDLFNLPGMAHKYKVLINQEALAAYLRDTVVAKSPDLVDFQVHFHDGFLLAQGVVRLNEQYSRKLLGAESLGFKLILVVGRVEEERVILNVKKFSMFNNNPGRVDFIRVYSAISRRIQTKLVEIFARKKTFFKFTPDIRHIIADMSRFMTAFPALMGKVKLEFCQFRLGACVFYTRSNLLLRSFLDVLTPAYVSVEEMDPDHDALALLWEKFIDS